MIGFSPLEGGQAISALWDFPRSESVLHWWDFFHSEDCICTLRWWDFFNSEVSKETCPRALFRLSLQESKPSAVRFFPLIVSHSAAGNFPSQNLRLMFCRLDFPTRSTSTSLGFSSPEPTGRLTPGSFPLSGSFHSYSDARDTTMLRSCHLYSDDGITPTRETTLSKHI